MGFVDYHAGDFGNLQITNNVVANKPYSVAGHIIVVNKPYSVPGNITGIFDSSKHQVTLYSQKSYPTGNEMAALWHGQSCYAHFDNNRLLEEPLLFTS